MDYSITTAKARAIATLVIKQTPHADVDYLINAALLGAFGGSIIDVLEGTDYSEELEDALNAKGAIEYHIKELS